MVCLNYGHFVYILNLKHYLNFFRSNMTGKYIKKIGNFGFLTLKGKQKQII